MEDGNGIRRDVRSGDPQDNNLISDRYHGV